MDLPVMPPIGPMLAKSVKTLPTGEGYCYEPKWDGFRCIVFCDGEEVELLSRNKRPLTRYFPELVTAMQQLLPQRCVLDGEIVIARGSRLDFEALLQRIHPAKSRIQLLAEQTPAWYVAFDLLALDDDSLLDQPFSGRRELLSTALSTVESPIYLTQLTQDPDLATRWFETFEGAGLDGVMVKPGNLPYRPDQRLMFKLKHERTADCVVAGFRWHKGSPPETAIGSLLLGLYDDTGQLQHIGVTAAFSAKQRAELIDIVAPYRADALENHPWASWATPDEIDPQRMPGAQSRWNAKKDLSWQPLRPELVVEVRYDHMEGTRFRHTAQFVRWRPDRTAQSCNFSQLNEAVNYDLADVLR